MLQSISWSQYCLTLLLTTAIYYIYIWIVFYKGRLSFFQVAHIRSFSMHGEDSPDEVMSTAQHIMDELRPLFIRRTNKNELILALQLKLKKYSEWDEPVFRDTINEFILKESQSKCSIRLGEEDQRAVWLTT